MVKINIVELNWLIEVKLKDQNDVLRVIGPTENKKSVKGPNDQFSLKIILTVYFIVKFINFFLSIFNNFFWFKYFFTRFFGNKYIPSFTNQVVFKLINIYLIKFNHILFN